MILGVAVILGVLVILGVTVIVGVAVILGVAVIDGVAVFVGVTVAVKDTHCAAFVDLPFTYVFTTPLINTNEFTGPVHVGPLFSVSRHPS